MASPEPIPDEALVVRGGRNQTLDFVRGTGEHPSGVVGVSVECSAEVELIDLARNIPHGRVGVTTVGAIRAAGGDVIRTSGRSKHHATLTGLSPEVARMLLNPTVTNPAKAEDQKHD